MPRPRFYTSTFCSPGVFKQGMAYLRENTDLAELGADHTFWDQHYPLRHDELLREINDYCVTAKVKTRVLTDGKDIGASAGMNSAMPRIPDLRDDDILIGYDADDRPFTKDWCRAALNVFAADPMCGWLNLTSDAVEHEMGEIKCTPITVGGTRVYAPGHPRMATLGMFRIGAVKAIGGFSQHLPYYGCIELDMMPKLSAAGYWYGWLADHRVGADKSLGDSEYAEWKVYHVGFKTPHFPGSFAEWLKR